MHVGMETREMAIHIANSACYFFAAHICAEYQLPFWKEGDDRIQTFRTKVFRQIPMHRYTRFFESIEAYDNYVNCSSKPIASIMPRKSRWDLLFIFFNTVEFRICDIPMTVQETIIAALSRPSAPNYTSFAARTSIS